MINENLDADRDRVLENMITFRHSQMGYFLEGELDHSKSRYNRAEKTGEFWGYGKYNTKPVSINAKVTAIGGYFNRGTTVISARFDANGNRQYDVGEPEIFPSQNPIPNKMLIIRFPEDSIGTPTLISPERGVFTKGNSPTFSWGNVQTAVRYILQADNNLDFSSPEILGENIYGVSYTQPTPLADGFYYWRVRGQADEDRIELVGPWSEVRSFTIDTTPPSPPGNLRRN